MKLLMLTSSGALTALLILTLGGSAAGEEAGASEGPPLASTEEVIHLESPDRPAPFPVDGAGTLQEEVEEATAQQEAEAVPPQGAVEEIVAPSEVEEAALRRGSSSVRPSPPATSGGEAEATVGVTARGPDTAGTVTLEEGCTAQDVIDERCDGGGQASLPFTVAARAQYRMPVFVDRDPANDLLMRYHLRASYSPPVEGLRVAALVGMSQRFIAVDDESPVLMEDMIVSLRYQHQVSLANVGWDRSLRFFHRLQAYLPTSRESRQQTLYIAPEVLTSARLEVLSGLNLALYLYGEYDFHRYAERAGLQGGLNTRLFLGGYFEASYQLLSSPRWGSLAVQAGAGLRYFLLYPSAERYESAASDRNQWEQDYSWAVGLSYTPVRYVSLEVGLEQNGADARRNGVRQSPSQFTFRNETQFVFSLWGRY